MKSLMLLLLLVFSIPELLATEIRSGQDVIISTPVTGDLYLAGNTLNINAAINGDLIAAGRSCFIRDTIWEDAVIIAQEIFLEGPIMDDARVLAGQIFIRADVFGDLIIGGGRVEIDPGVTIHGNLYAGGGTVNLHGRVLGQIELAGGEVFFDGIAEGESQLKAGNLRLAGTFQGPARLSAEKIELSDQAVFSQNVRYWTKAGELDFGPYLRANSTAQFDESLQSDVNNYGWRSALGIGFAFFAVGRILSAALLLVLLTWAFSNFFRRTAEHLTGNYANSLGYGILYLLATPLLILIALVSLIGIPVGIFSLATYGLSLGFAHIITALLFTYWWQETQQQVWQKRKVILVAIGVFVLLKLISWIPIIGWLISLAAIAITLGAMLRELLRAKQHAEPEQEPIEPFEMSV